MGVSHNMGRIASIAGAAGEARGVAKVFVAGSAILAGSATMPEPGNADTLARAEAGHTLADYGDPADDLVTRNDRKMRRDFAIQDMQIGSAYAAGRYLDQHLARPRRRHGTDNRMKRPAHGIELYRVHGVVGHAGDLQASCFDTTTRVGSSP